MDKETRRAELASRIKASFDESNISEELNLYSRIMNDVYSWQMTEEPIVKPHSATSTTHLPQKTS